MREKRFIILGRRLRGPSLSLRSIASKRGVGIEVSSREVDGVSSCLRLSTSTTRLSSCSSLFEILVLLLCLLSLLSLVLLLADDAPEPESLLRDDFDVLEDLDDFEDFEVVAEPTELREDLLLSRCDSESKALIAWILEEFDSDIKDW